jgi:hypothetical protein
MKKLEINLENHQLVTIVSQFSEVNTARDFALRSLKDITYHSFSNQVFDETEIALINQAIDVLEKSRFVRDSLNKINKTL